MAYVIDNFTSCRETGRPMGMRSRLCSRVLKSCHQGRLLAISQPFQWRQSFRYIYYREAYSSWSPPSTMPSDRRVLGLCGGIQIAKAFSPLPPPFACCPYPKATPLGDLALVNVCTAIVSQLRFFIAPPRWISTESITHILPQS